MNHATQKVGAKQNKPARLPICPQKHDPKQSLTKPAIDGTKPDLNMGNSGLWRRVPWFFWGLNLESCFFEGYPKQP